MKYTDPVTGRSRETVRAARTRAAACDIRDRLLRELEQTDGRSLAFEKATFADLADWYERHYLLPPQYVDGRKVSGLRSFQDQIYRLGVLRRYFGRKTVRAITYSDLRALKRERLATPTRAGKQRAIASVNRELDLLRRMLNIAAREGWIIRNPFLSGDSLISLADERQRERVLTAEEEVRLLAAADRPRYRHLTPIIICALDTGMRIGEILKLTWSDLDFHSRRITVRAFNTKTMRQRQVSMTNRLFRALMHLASNAAEPDALVFGVTDTVKNAFATVRSRAGLSDVRFHDLRHTAATRLVRGGMPLPEVGRILGHTNPKTTYRYINSDDSTADRAAAILDALVPTLTESDLPQHLLN